MRLPAHWRDSLAVALLLTVVLCGVLLAYQGSRRHSDRFWNRYLAALESEPADMPAARRVIALSLAAEEVILDLAGPERLAAVTPWARDPRFSNVTSLTGPVEETVNGQSIETILHLEPDTVVVAPYTDLRAKRVLRRGGIRVVELPMARSFEHVRTTIEHLGRVVGEPAAARRLRTEFDGRLERARRRAAAGPFRGRRLLYVGTPLDSPWTAGSSTLVNACMEATGLVNVAAAEGLEREGPLPQEALLRWEPDILLVEGEPGERASRLERLRSHPVLSGLDAVGRGRVVLLPARLLTTTSHYAGHLAEQLAVALEQLPEHEP